MMHRLSRLALALGILSFGTLAAAGAAPSPGTRGGGAGPGAAIEGELTLTASLGARTLTVAIKPLSTKVPSGR